jgi:hypothetical protein
MAQQQRTNERVAFARATQRACNRRLIYPILTELPPFENLFPIVVVESIAKGEEIQGDVISISIPPSNIATAYRFMYVFGKHL